MIRLILKVAAAFIVGIGYGLLNAMLTSVLWGLTHDAEHPGPMIPNANEWGEFVAWVSGIVAGTGAIIVGLIVGLSGMRMRRGGLLGLGVGIAVFLLLTRFGATLVTPGGIDWRSLVNPGTITLTLLPVALALIGMLLSFVAGLLNKLDR